ncbi:hypothetical protein [Azospirillum picis]|uniref:Paraquat-inducible protein A n=1 Tax=Azospirillum picis TaxID=488438 RepID=A0ABU0MUJ1_9PROT|nr:hypothetical protein [Azospirillum picis]MBP2303299.1 putative paraquat-inducible protein A [Azospirillum picis]MDQ0537161.1 putative paraquat-inducible protein A [Azospirillum picis]
MAGPFVSEGDLRRALALVIAYHDAGRPMTSVQLGEAMNLSAEGGRLRSRHLADRGLVEIRHEKGANRIYPTSGARILDLPRVEDATAPAKRQRPCMRCHQTITSDGPHHRHCNRCRESLAKLSGSGCFAF